MTGYIIFVAFDHFDTGKPKAVLSIRPKQVQQNQHCLLGFAASIALISCIGCSTGRAPTAVLRNAELNIRSADEARAGEFAAVDLKNARDKLARAKQAMAADRYEEARRFAERAQVDAELAEAKAEARLMRRAADQILKKADGPPTDAESDSRKPLAPPPTKE